MGEWKERTIKQTNQIIRSYIDAPTKDNPLIKNLIDIANGRQDGYITIKASTGGQGKKTIEGPMGWSLQRFQANPLLLRGIKIFIPISKLHEIYFDIYFTLGMTYASRSFDDFYLNVPWVELMGKAQMLYNEYFNIFEDAPKGEYTPSFTTEMGGGFTRNGGFKTKYKDFARSSITFNTQNIDETQKALASMVFYLLFIPDAFSIVRTGVSTGQKIFLLADALGVYTHKYFKAKVGSNILSDGVFYWEDNKESYKQIIKNILGIISDGDLRFFLYFNYNSGTDDILSHYINKFNEWFERFEDTNGNIDSFEGIDDLRKPLS